MSRHFGNVAQNGYVVRDIEAAMRHWSAVLGVGPWFYAEQAPIENFRNCPGIPAVLRPCGGVRSGYRGSA
ncbi:MAG: VOC family protein [Proteobacteria bacterium]|nr:VOC family protein [Pseudomonadota bacterium]